MTGQSPIISYKQGGEGVPAPLSQASRCMPSYRPTRRLRPRSYSGTVVRRRRRLFHLRSANPVVLCVLLRQSVKSASFFAYRKKKVRGGGIQLRTRDSFWQTLEHFDCSTDDAWPSFAQLRRHSARLHLEQRRYRNDRQSFVVHTRQPVLFINGRKPVAEEHLRPMRVLSVHQRKGSPRVVEYRIDEHLEVRQLKRLCFCFVKVFECSCNNMLELLCLGT